ncbi:MAG TPA: hypothetical protein VFQ68_18095 [Streptosporangiaceae bacterium]|nr:hypothetical protein [Streptosporangiaceae bacterium]
MQQAEVGRISESQPAKLLSAEPSDGVVLLWLHVRDGFQPFGALLLAEADRLTA